MKKNTHSIWPVQAPCQIAYRDPISGYFWLRPYVDLQRKGKIWGIAINGIVYYLKHESDGDWNTAITLKDERSVIRAVMFAGNARRLKFRPQDGMARPEGQSSRQGGVRGR